MILPTIICNNYKAIWEDPPETLSLTNAVDIWRIRVISSLSLLNNMEAFLQPDELEIASRFHQLKDKHRFIIRRGALRILLGKYLSVPANDIQFLTGDNKKPFVKQNEGINLQYNVSHSGDYILIAITNSDTGVDIEQVNPDFIYDEVLHQSFSTEEIDYIKQGQETRKLFYKLWTRKEALTKATSKGMDDDIADIPSLDGIHHINASLLGSEKSWMVSSFEINEQYTGSIAYHPDQSVRFWNFTT